MGRLANATQDARSRRRATQTAAVARLAVMLLGKKCFSRVLEVVIDSHLFSLTGTSKLMASKLSTVFDGFHGMQYTVFAVIGIPLNRISAIRA